VFKTWTGSAESAEALARSLEAHLNEFAEHVVSVSYVIEDGHHVFAVYEQIDMTGNAAEEAAVSVAEQIIDEALP
jgi:hypothetical protein